MTLCRARRLVLGAECFFPAVLLMAAAALWLGGPSGLSPVLAVLAAASGVGLFALLSAVGGRIRTACDEQSDLGNQLIQSQKLLSLGEISMGIAHEINNPLNVIMQEAELMRADLGGDIGPGTMSEVMESLDVILRQVERCSDITHKLLDFARRRVPITQPADINRLVEDMLDLLERGGGAENVEIVKAFDPDLPQVETDPPLLRQVFLNLLINAIQAMEEKKGGLLYVTTYSEDAKVCVEVRDTGPGIAKENIARIFNPFFTTKAPGKGTGLGLSVSLRIVNQLGGEIAVRSEAGEGAAFTVCIPATSAKR